MNKYKWSAIHNAFIHVATVDDYLSAGWDLSDLIDISDDIYREFGAQHPKDKQRGVIDGMPAWIDSPPLTMEELISSATAKKSQLKAIADSEIAWRQDAIDGAYAEAGEVTELAAWKKYRVFVMRVDLSKPVWPEAPTPLGI